MQVQRNDFGEICLCLAYIDLAKVVGKKRVQFDKNRKILAFNSDLSSACSYLYLNQAALYQYTRRCDGFSLVCFPLVFLLQQRFDSVRRKHCCDFRFAGTVGEGRKRIGIYHVCMKQIFLCPAANVSVCVSDEPINQDCHRHSRQRSCEITILVN